MEIVRLSLKIFAAIRAHPSRTGTAVTCVALLAFASARWMGGGAARASAGVGLQARQQPPVVKTDTIPPTTPISAQLRDWSRGPIAPISRNLFYINQDRFPLDDRIAKSGALRTEDQGKRVAQAPAATESIEVQAARLHLQSILMGPTPKALVDGQLLNEGDVVADFRVVKITARGIVLERDGVKLELAFK